MGIQLEPNIRYFNAAIVDCNTYCKSLMQQCFGQDWRKHVEHKIIVDKEESNLSTVVFSIRLRPLGYNQVWGQKYEKIVLTYNIEQKSFSICKPQVFDTVLIRKLSSGLMFNEHTDYYTELVDKIRGIINDPTLWQKTIGHQILGLKL